MVWRAGESFGESVFILGLDWSFRLWLQIHTRISDWLNLSKLRQRESEELLQQGIAAFHRGDAAEARRLLTAAIDGGAPSEEALAVLGRLDRLELGGRPAEPVRLRPNAAASV